MEEVTLIRFGCVKKSEIKFRKFSVIFEDVSLALQHWDMSVGREVNKFMKELIEKFDVYGMRILFGNNRVKDGHQFVTKEEFKEDNLGSKVQYKTRTLMLDMHDPNTHSMPSHNNNQVGVAWVSSCETCYRLKDKALRCLVKVISTDDSHYMHDKARVEKLLTGLRKEVPKKVEHDKLLHNCCDMFMTLKTSSNQYEEVGCCINKTGWLLQVRR